ncbi:hypothetical protein CH254_24210 [Rhodococcus sp. 06-412-2C]|uniref:sedoheptulokinase n=1 Tax=unclassified Rhodococcus (in: high G+C Gram-positive bacteria) TaxID=192944 RepID=UPI000B9BB29E|nr:MULTISPECIES: FGGY family carbohydrate kinase [unclassified Rhodococcus (in: high G+C Gram-positive bacteria)]OZC83989.1 hypothetical protein CH254_24210 [Rhodococcus sp. 06-412-2C]OZC94175.1 hypothetical protein CH279_22295 [Rhodococcus sp. 06-412-2B]
MLLAVDIGSTTIKSALVPESGELLDVRSVPTPAPALNARPGRHETDSELIVQAVLAMIDERLYESADIDSVAFSTQMHGALLTDSDGRPLTGYLSWQDERGYENSAKGKAVVNLESAAGGNAIERSGIPLRPGLPSTNLFAVIRGDDDRIRPGQTIRLHTIGSLVLHTLIGRAITHLSSAASTGLVDVSTGTWDPELIAALGIESDGLPEITESYAPVGLYNGPHGVVSVLPDLGDQQATVAGVGLNPERDVLLSIGTAGLVGRLTTAVHTGGYIENRPGPDRSSRLLSVSRLPGGRALDVFVEFFRTVGSSVFGVDASTDAIRGAISRLADSDAPSVNVALLSLADRRLDAAITGIMPSMFTAEGLVAGIRRSLVDEYSLAISSLFGHHDAPGRIVIVGGVADTAGPWLERDLAARFGCAVDTLGGGELALTGIARLAASFAQPSTPG